jgi:hypothetical protein
VQEQQPAGGGGQEATLLCVYVRACMDGLMSNGSLDVRLAMDDERLEILIRKITCSNELSKKTTFQKN